ncbi:hypothetical protein A9Q99_14550 [Gammaproteobacteria bacterium 45_16_T64]|nr:hypothetical protein A9Q99_14550 [Gammaproteobacteria bacterium 45_16_T64]
MKVANDYGREEIVRYLISKGANIDALDVEFQFDSKPMKSLQDGIEDLEQKIESECGKFLTKASKSTANTLALRARLTHEK